MKARKAPITRTKAGRRPKSPNNSSQKREYLPRGALIYGTNTPISQHSTTIYAYNTPDSTTNTRHYATSEVKSLVREALYVISTLKFTNLTIIRYN